MILTVSDLLLLIGWFKVMHQTGLYPNEIDFRIKAVIFWIFSLLITLRSQQFQNTSILNRSGLHFKQVLVFGSFLIFYKIFFENSLLSPGEISGMALGFTALAIPRIGIHQFVIAQPGVPNNVLLIGKGAVSRSIEQLFINSGNDRVIGFVDDQPESELLQGFLGRTEDLESIFNSTPFNQMIISTQQKDISQVKKIMRFSENHGIRTSIILDEPSFLNRNFELRDLGGLTMADFREIPLNQYMPRFWKRGFDFLFSFLALVILTPVFLIIAAAIKLESKGPVLYRAVRIGRNGKSIRVLKFRSMYVQLDSSQEKISAKRNDPRVTRVGKFLRRYSLDELPQFFNVLGGSMSVVGPRPHRTDLDQKFREIFPSYPVRRFIKPGITGWAQINGYRGLTETDRDYKARALHDIWYMEHWSFGLDLLIIFFTVFGKKTKQNVF